MNNKLLKRRMAFGITLILLAAIVGLIFVKADYVSGNQVTAPASQSSAELFSSGSDKAIATNNSMSVLPSLIRIISALVIVVFGIYAGIYLLKKMMGRRFTGQKNIGNLEVLETIHIAPRKSVTLLRVGNKSVLVGSTESNVSLLSELAVDETTRIMQSTEIEANKPDFNEFMKTAVGRVKEFTQKYKKSALKTT